VDAELYDSEADRRGPHGWNSLENYTFIHEKRLAEHPFVDHGVPNTLKFEDYVNVDGDTVVLLSGEVYCHYGIVVAVTKSFETRMVQGRLQVRGVSYRYNARIRGRHNILRYDNGHDESPDEFHRHQYDLSNGTEIETRIITRYDLPVFDDILTELQQMFEETP